MEEIHIAPVEEEVVKPGSPDRTKTIRDVYLLLTPLEKRLVFLALVLGMFLAALDQMIVAVALPVIAQQLNGITLLPWIVAAYLISSSAAMPLYGKFSDLYGRRWVMVTAIVIFLAGSAVCGASTEIWMLIVMRGVQGVGGGGLMAMGMIVIGDIAPPRDRPKYMASVTMVFGVASILGPVIGGALVDASHTGWRWIFYINLPIGAVALAIAIIYMRKIEVKQKNARADVLGAILIAIAVSSLSLGLIQGGSSGWSWTGYKVWICFAIFIVFTIAFVLWEFRFPDPILRMGLFANRNFTLCSLILFFAGMTMFGAFSYMPSFFERVRNDSARTAGLNLTPMVLGMFLVSISAGIFISKTGKWRVFPPLGTACFALGAGLCSLVKHNHGQDNFGFIFIYLVVLGMGLGVVLPVINTVVQNSVGPKDMASAMAAVAFFRNIGGSIGISFLGTILNNKANDYANAHGIPEEMAQLNPEGFNEAFSFMLLISVAPAALAFVFSLFLKPVDFNKNFGAPPAGEKKEEKLDPNAQPVAGKTNEEEVGLTAEQRAAQTILQPHGHTPETRQEKIQDVERGIAETSSIAMASGLQNVRVHDLRTEASRASTDKDDSQNSRNGNTRQTVYLPPNLGAQDLDEDVETLL